MARNKEIHDFAIKYHNLFSNPQTTEADVTSTFGEECQTLGFDLYTGEDLQNAFPDLDMEDAEKLEEVIDSISDEQLLGSAIYSKWWNILRRNFTKEECGFLSLENRGWFIVALTMLAVLADGESPFVFRGSLKRARIISNNICDWPEPHPGDEIEQRISITEGKGIWLTRYRYGGPDDRLQLMRREKIRTEDAVVKDILNAIAISFEDHVNDFELDVGSWTIELTDEEGKVTKLNGSLVPNAFDGLSDYIRERLNRDDLFLFDGNPDRVDQIEMTYDRHQEFEVADPADPEQPYAIWDYHEELKISRDTETVELYRQIFSDCDVRNTYHIAGGVSVFLDSLEPYALSEAEGNPPDVFVDPFRTEKYKITVTTRRAGTREISGLFDKNGLPKDWSEFSERLLDFLLSYGLGEIFDERAYGKVRRRAGDLIFCNVVFTDGGKEYCYLSHEDHDVGDLVVVPAGKDDHEAVVRVESVEYHPAEEAPYPLDKIKIIIRKFDRERDMELIEG